MAFCSICLIFADIIMNITINNIVSAQSIFGRNVAKLCQSTGLKSFTNLIGGGKNSLQHFLTKPTEDRGILPYLFSKNSLDNESLFDTPNALNLQDINGVNLALSSMSYGSAGEAYFVSLFVYNSSKVN